METLKKSSVDNFLNNLLDQIRLFERRENVAFELIQMETNITTIGDPMLPYLAERKIDYRVVEANWPKEELGG